MQLASPGQTQPVHSESLKALRGQLLNKKAQNVPNITKSSQNICGVRSTCRAYKHNPAQQGPFLLFLLSFPQEENVILMFVLKNRVWLLSIPKGGLYNQRKLK